jgi:hypothetical protein
VWGQPYPGDCIPGLGRGGAVVVCRVSGLRGQGRCGVEAHGHGSRVVALVGGFGWCGWQWGISAGVPVSKPSDVVLFHRLVWCGVGAGVPVLEAGGAVSFGWHGDVVPRGICGVGGRARCRVVAVAQLCGHAGPVSVDRHDVAGCSLSVGFVVVSGEVVGGVEGAPHGSPPLGSPPSLSTPPLASCMPHIP